jgi:hypothetical protein
LRFILAAAILFVSACGGGGGGGSSSPGTTTTPPGGTSPPVDGVVTTFSVTSQQSQLTYPISVWSPADAATGKPPPVIYILDADYRFAPLLDALKQSGVRATLVGVNDLGANQRQVDFLEPGADPYYNFLTKELFPVIESRYRVDPARRVLSGHSSGGLFCMYAFFKDTPANRPFFSYICADGSYWQQPDLVYAAEASMYAAHPTHDLPLTLVMGADLMGNGAYMDPLYQQVLSRHYTSLQISEHMYDLGHLPMDAPFFYDALAIVFPTKN